MNKTPKAVKSIIKKPIVNTSDHASHARKAARGSLRAALEAQRRNIENKGSLKK